MQYTEIFFFSNKNRNFQKKMFDIFLIFAKKNNVDHVHTLEPPHRGGSNEYPQSMFWSKNNKYRCTPLCIHHINVGYTEMLSCWIFTFGLNI